MNINEELVKDALHKVSGIDKSKPLHKSEIEAIQNLTQAGVFNIEIPENRIIDRVRLNKGSVPFKNIHEISYPPVGMGDIEFQRMNSNNSPLFYGAVSSPEMRQPHIAALSEVVSYDSLKDGAVFYATHSQWLCIEPLRCAVVGLSENLIENNSNAISMKSIQDELLHSNPIAKKVHNFLAEEFSRVYTNHLEYQVTSYYAQKTLDFPIDAIIYPTVKGDGVTFCIAVRPQSVDKKLALRAVGLMKCIKVQKDIIGGYDIGSDQFKKGVILYEDAPPSARLSNLDVQELFKKHGIS
ncbi:MAG: hypothetical protein ACFB2Y_02630 [Fulvivirga sp.]